MAPRDQVHNQVVNALRKDGWIITHDPFKVRWKKRTLQIDLGAEQLVAATNGNLSIAVEIKSFIGANDLEDLYDLRTRTVRFWATHGSKEIGEREFRAKRYLGRLFESIPGDRRAILSHQRLPIPSRFPE